MVALYHGSKKIRDRSSYGIYKGSTPIKAIYKGSTLVYQYQPYDPSTVLVNTAGEATKTLTLQPGVYYVEVTGGGGRSSISTPSFPTSWFTCGGGSGASVYGEFYLPTARSVTLYVAPERGISYMNIAGTRIITANPGGSNYDNAPGGTGSINTANIITNISVTSHTGNAGKASFGAGGTAGASVSPRGWGKGGSPNNLNLVVGGAGGIYLQYKRLTA